MARSLSKTKTMPIRPIETVKVVGCGGTGSILAEHICRMIGGFRLDVNMVLYDGDIVTAANIARQNFAPHEIGANKFQVLVLRLAGQFGMQIHANAEHFAASDVSDINAMIITCTDTLQSRRIVNCCSSGFWLDAGNELNRGQAIIGTTDDKKLLTNNWQNFDKWPHAKDLPNIAAMNPAIANARKSRVRAGCADQPFAEQGFGVNAMAALTTAMIAKQVLVDREIRTPQIYFNVSEGRMMAAAITRDMFNRWKPVKK